MSAKQSSPSYDALVAGAGPVGLTMALELARQGLKVRIVDCAPQATDKSKALVLWGRTLELLQQSGDVAADFFPAGMEATASSIYGDGKRLVHITFDRKDTAFPQPLMIPQSETERILAERLAARGVKVERPVEMIDYVLEGETIISTLQHADGTTEEVTTCWLLGCDGSHSRVRKAMGVEFAGDFEPNDWILADIHIDGDLPHNEISIFWHTRGLAAFFPIGGSRRFRVVADLGKAPGTGKPADPTLEEVQATINARGLERLKLYDPVWLAGFRIHERKVNEYSRGRVFLAGDAAHVHSPAGGQGMNTGMQDAFNLAWKIALVHHGHAPFSPLVDSYHQERNAVGELVLHNATRLTTIATLRNPFLQFVRDHVAYIAGKLSHVQQQFVADLTEMSIHYHDSVLNADDAGSAWAGDVKVGDRLPDAEVLDLAAGQSLRLLNLLAGTGHRLLVMVGEGEEQTVEELLHAARGIESDFRGLLQTTIIFPADSTGSLLPMAGVHAGTHLLIDAHGDVFKRLGLRDTAIALVRPDGYLAFRGHAKSWDALRHHLGTYLQPVRQAVAQH